MTNTKKIRLFAHKTTQKYINNFMARNKTLNINKFFNKPKESCLEDKIDKAETLMVMMTFMGEHNAPFSHVESLASDNKSCNSKFII